MSRQRDFEAARAPLLQVLGPSASPTWEGHFCTYTVGILLDQYHMLGDFGELVRVAYSTLARPRLAGRMQRRRRRNAVRIGRTRQRPVAFDLASGLAPQAASSLFASVGAAS